VLVTSVILSRVDCIVPSNKYTNFSFSVLLHTSTHYFLDISVLSHFSIDFAPQMKTRYLTVEDRACIVGMHQGNAKGVEIVAALSHPKNTVSTVLKEFEHRGSVEYQIN
jgi:hypothetical protein